MSSDEGFIFSCVMGGFFLFCWFMVLVQVSDPYEQNNYKED